MNNEDDGQADKAEVPNKEEVPQPEVGPDDDGQLVIDGPIGEQQALAGMDQGLALDSESPTPIQHYGQPMGVARQAAADPVGAFDIMMDSHGNVDGGLSVDENELGHINA